MNISVVKVFAPLERKRPAVSDHRERLAIILSFLFFTQGATVVHAADTAAASHMLNLSCVEALVVIKEPELAGVFSFIPELDTPAAFADLLAHKRANMRRYLAKLDSDRKVAGGITIWDHNVVDAARALYASPLAQTLDAPSESTLNHLAELAAATPMKLEDVAMHRGR